MRGRQVFRFCFDESDGDGLGIGIDLDAKDIIYPPFRLFSRLTVNDFDSPGSLLPANEVLGPAVRRHLFERKPQHSIVIGRRPAAAVAVAGEKIDCAIRSLGYISQPAEL